MPFLGKQPTAGFASIVKDDLTGNGTEGPYTLSKQVANANDIAVFVGNVRQEPTDAYTVSGNQLTMTGTVSSSTNFYVLHIAGTVESSVVPADGTITSAKMSNFGFTTNAGDPSITSNKTPLGHLWINTTTGETYVLIDATTNANVWKNVGDGTGGFPPPYNVDFLCIAGGASGGGPYGGGGGAGGYRQSNSTYGASGGASSAETHITLTPGIVYTISVGGGGAGHATIGSAVTQGNNGNNSFISGDNFTTLTSIGGGGGGGRWSGGSTTSGNSGGSGGGAGDNYPNTTVLGGAGTAGQGHNGGGGSHVGFQGSGGGGSGAVGVNASSGGNGGAGTASTITGSSVTRAGGGGGGDHSAGAGAAGGSGGGGAGGGQSTHGVAGTANTGSGGGGAQDTAPKTSGAGGSGLIVLRMPTANYSGTTTGSPTVTTSGSDTILTFTGSGSYTA